MMMMDQRSMVILVAMVVSTVVLNVVSTQMKLGRMASPMGMFLMSLPRPVMMILMAIPEQTVLMMMEPSMPLMKRLMVSVAMYAIHFAWNGFVMKPQKSYNELVWILGTALFAYLVGVKQKTAVALVAADSVMTLALRGL